jgi:arylsulfatase A-like enzyme
MSMASGVALTAGADLRADERRQQPNILWICTDQQRYDTFLTGMYPSTIHACINGNDHWDEAAPLIAKTLADIGYDCALAGKFHLSSAMAHEPELRPKDDGYRRFWYSHAPHQGIGKGNQYTDWLTSIGQDYKKLKKKYGYIPAQWHQTTWCADRAIEFMKEERKDPWLCSVNIYDPHGPFDPPQEYVDRFTGPLTRHRNMWIALTSNPCPNRCSANPIWLPSSAWPASCFKAR